MSERMEGGCGWHLTLPYATPPESWLWPCVCPHKETHAQKCQRAGPRSPVGKWWSKDLHAGLSGAESPILSPAPVG